MGRLWKTWEERAENILHALDRARAIAITLGDTNGGRRARIVLPAQYGGHAVVELYGAKQGWTCRRTSLRRSGGMRNVQERRTKRITA